jgi:uncharacterized membrane protein
MEPGDTDRGAVAAPAWLDATEHKLSHSHKLDAVAEQLAPVAQPFGSGRAGEVLGGRWLGHALHPLLSDLPLGCWLSASVLDVIGGRSSRPASRRLIGVGLVLSVPTAASGMADWSHASHTDARVRRLGVVHAAGNAVATVLYFGSWRARRRGRHLRGMGLSAVAGALAAGTGWLGGHMAIAYGASGGDRGLGHDSPRRHHHGRDDDGGGDLLDVEQASRALGVPVAQVQTMVADGLLVPVAGTADPRFRSAEVEAVRHLGG